MADFNEKDKVERGSQYFDEGEYEVTVVGVTFGETNDGKEYCDISVTDKEGAREADGRFWFNTDGGRAYAFGQIRNMVVHNVPEARKDAARKQFNAIKNTEELEAAINKVLVKDAGQIWLQVYQDGTYVNDKGETKPSYKRDLFGYPPAKRKNTTTTSTPASDGAPHPADAPGADNEQVVAGF